MPDTAGFSPDLLAHAEAKNPAALARIGIAKTRIQSILDRETIAHQKTLEQKISEQGPRPLRVDPHLVGLAIFDLKKLNRLASHKHQATGNQSWYSNISINAAAAAPRLAELAPLYASITGGGFGNLTGDALEVIIYKCLERAYVHNPRYAYQGHFHLAEPKNAQGRYTKTQPPKFLGSRSTTKEADFLQFGHDTGALCIECKNYREWIYPHHQIIKDLIVKATDLNAMPTLIVRRLHYSTVSNLLEPSGIIAHETYSQYYPADQAALAAEVSHKRKLGFTDVLASEEPDTRTMRFIVDLLPKLSKKMQERWEKNQAALRDYAEGRIHLANLYTAIGSPAGGKWIDYDQGPDFI